MKNQNINKANQIPPEKTIRFKSYQFLKDIVETYKFLRDEKKEWVMSWQLLKSGTSIGANIRESKNAESTADFIHKLQIAQKECDETQYWLELLYDTNYLPKEKFNSLYNKAQELYRM